MLDVERRAGGRGRPALWAQVEWEGDWEATWVRACWLSQALQAEVQEMLGRASRRRQAADVRRTRRAAAVGEARRRGAQETCDVDDAMEDATGWKRGRRVLRERGEGSGRGAGRGEVELRRRKVVRVEEEEGERTDAVAGAKRGRRMLRERGADGRAQRGRGE